MAQLLVVDDDPTVRALVREVLELAGHDVRTAEDGYAGLRAVAAERPDGVVLDVQMPGMDGHEVLARLRAGDRGRSLPVIMLTAAADDANAWRSWSGGVDYFLGKPFDAEQLLRCLDHLAPVRRAVGHGARC